MDTRLRHLICCLLSVHFKRFDTLSKHIDLLVDAFQVCFERSLQYFECSLLLQFLLLESIQGVEAELEQRAEETFGRPGLVARDGLLQVPQNSLLTVVINYEEVGLV